MGVGTVYCPASSYLCLFWASPHLNPIVPRGWRLYIPLELYSTLPCSSRHLVLEQMTLGWLPTGFCFCFVLFFVFFFFVFVFFFFETGFLCIALAVLELTLLTRLASNSEIRLPLPPKCWDQRRVPPCPALIKHFF